MDVSDDEILRLQEERKEKEQELAALASVSFDTDLYGGGGSRFEGYEQSIAVVEDDEEQDATEREVARWDF